MAIFIGPWWETPRGLSGTQVATVQNSTAVEPLKPPPSPLELEHRAATLSMKLGAVFFFKSYGQRDGDLQREDVGILWLHIGDVGFEQFVENILFWSIFSYHECVWTVAPGPKENRHLGSAISNQY